MLRLSLRSKLIHCASAAVWRAFSSATQPTKGNDLRNRCRLRAIKQLLLAERDKEADASQTKRTVEAAAGRRECAVSPKRAPLAANCVLTMKSCVRGPNTSRHGQRLEPLRKTISNGVRLVFTCAWSTWHSASGRRMKKRNTVLFRSNYFVAQRLITAIGSRRD